MNSHKAPLARPAPFLNWITRVSAMSKPPVKLSLERALHLLRKPDARLVRLHSNDGGAGFYVWPGGGRVPDEVAQLLLGRNDIQPFDNGLFPGHPQSWRLGNWREWA
jgi:hypothetical protein